jgi:hypothetical protein
MIRDCGSWADLYRRLKETVATDRKAAGDAFCLGREPFGLLPSATAAQRELVSHLREIDTVSLKTLDHASPDVLTRCHQTFSRCAVDGAWQRCRTSNNNTIRKSCAGTR